MERSISMNMALSMAGPKAFPRPSISRLRAQSESNMERPQSSSSKKIVLYDGVSDRPLGWKPKKIVKTAQDMSVRRWDGAARKSREWDCLRKDSELWYPKGDCLVHLYEQGQSRRGPAFKVHMDTLLEAKCFPLLERFLGNSTPYPFNSDADNAASNSPKHKHNKHYDLYIPAPTSAEREQAYLYHTATRNFFAWVFGKPLVGIHLGGALVGLLNSMNEFRSKDVDNVQDILDYMDEEMYGDMRNQPDHALAILFFAEKFQFRDLWIDAFAHCTGMNERLMTSMGFEFMSRSSRALVTRSRLEMDMRLSDCGRRLASFLSDDLSDTHLGFSSAARAHLDKFRSFLQSYYVAKLGYYPPTSCELSSAAFPLNIYRQMCAEFQKLYDYLVDSEFTSNNDISLPHHGGICVLQSIQAFDARYKYKSLKHPLPRLPDLADESPSRPNFNRRFSFVTRDKIRPDPRLVTYASLSKATNAKDLSLMNCSLVRAYRGFEKDCVFSPLKAVKIENLSHVDARKVRWILVYSMLQTLLSASKVPSEVRDKHNVPYNLAVQVADCPSWEDRPLQTLFRTQTRQMLEDHAANRQPFSSTAPTTPFEIKPDVDYFAITHKADQSRRRSNTTLLSMESRKSSIRKALSTLGNMPELRHPRPQRASYHEILVYGYGNGTNTTITAEPQSEDLKARKSSESGSSTSAGEMSSRWSHSSTDTTEEPDSPTTSMSSQSRRGSDLSFTSSTTAIKEFLDGPMKLPKLARVPSSIYSSCDHDIDVMQPEPLELKRHLMPEECMKITTEVHVDWEDSHGKANDELLAYLSA